MATYLGTHGSRIQNYTTDPDNPNTGEVWYNATDNVLKFQYTNTTSAGSWRTGGSLNTARYGLGGSGTQDSALGYGGLTPSQTGATESYNGSSWTEVADLNTTRTYLWGAGADNTSALAFGGFNGPGNAVLAVTEGWNGSSWTEVNDLNTARRFLAGN